MFRIHKQRARAFLIEKLASWQGVASIPDEWEDMFLVELETSEKIAVYLEDRFISTDDVHNTFIENRKSNLYTLYILSGAMMLPDHNEIYVPEDWMELLAQVYGGKIYCYRVYRQNVDICPIYFHELGDGSYHILYGEKIQAKQLQAHQIRVHHETWLVADFEHVWIYEYSEETPVEMSWPLSPRFDGEPHEVLGIAHNANQQVVHSAYRQLARQYHPDVDPSPEATARMQAINEAYRAFMWRLRNL